MDLRKSILDAVKRTEKKASVEKNYRTIAQDMNESFIGALTKEGIKKEASDVSYSICRVSPVQFQIYDFATKHLEHRNILGTAEFLHSLNSSKSIRTIQSELQTYPQYNTINISASIIQKTAKVPDLWKKEEIDGKEYIVRAHPDQAGEIATEESEKGTKKTASVKKAYDTEELKEELDDIIRQEIQGKMSPRDGAEHIMNIHNVPGLQEYVENYIGNEFDLSHYIENLDEEEESEDPGKEVKEGDPETSIKELKSSITNTITKIAAQTNNAVLPFHNGMPCVASLYNEMLIPIAQYCLTGYVRKNPPVIASSTRDYSKEMGLQDIESDVDELTEVVGDGVMFYNDKIIAAYSDYQGFHIDVYAKNREIAHEIMGTLRELMIHRNQYRGKCLFAEKGSFRFHETPKNEWNDIVLEEKVKKDIKLNTVSFLGDEKLRKAGVNRRGLIMYGLPGCGKTSVCKAIFKDLAGKGVSRLYVTAESFRRMSMSSLFDLLSYLGPTVLAFEDIDTVGTSRDIIADNGLLGDLLTNLDGFRNAKDPLVVLASTNKIGFLDEALANRPCRFDRKIELGLPTAANLKQIYMNLLGKDVDDEVIKLSAGYTGSHVVETCNTAKILAASEEREILDCLKEACAIINSNFFGR